MIGDDEEIAAKHAAVVARYGVRVKGRRIAIATLASEFRMTRCGVWKILTAAAERGEVELKHYRPRGFNARCVELAEVAGMTPHEIAEALKAPVANVRVALSKARRVAKEKAA